MSNCTPKPETPLIIGHRGAMGYETENTLASIEKAMELGVDMIEIDVFRIQTGEIAVFHDERVERLANSGGRIEEYNFFDMKKLILDGGHRIPILQEVLKLVDHKVPLNIELKGAGTASPVQHIVSYYCEQKGWTPDQFIISSFNWDELRAYRALDPEARIAVLVEGNPLEALEVAAELKAEAINPHYTQVNAENVARIHQEGYKVYTWTVNDPADFQKLKTMGVDGVFSNFPDQMR
jgi:glycerophosphoryl diester phosphodiesterase